MAITKMANNNIVGLTNIVRTGSVSIYNGCVSTMLLLSQIIQEEGFKVQGKTCSELFGTFLTEADGIQVGKT